MTQDDDFGTLLGITNLQEDSVLQSSPKVGDLDAVARNLHQESKGQNPQNEGKHLRAAPAPGGKQLVLDNRKRQQQNQDAAQVTSKKAPGPHNTTTQKSSKGYSLRSQSSPPAAVAVTAASLGKRKRSKVDDDDDSDSSSSSQDEAVLDKAKAKAAKKNMGGKTGGHKKQSKGKAIVKGTVAKTKKIDDKLHKKKKAKTAKVVTKTQAEEEDDEVGTDDQVTRPKVGQATDASRAEAVGMSEASSQPHLQAPSSKPQDLDILDSGLEDEDPVDEDGGDDENTLSD